MQPFIFDPQIPEVSPGCNGTSGSWLPPKSVLITLRIPYWMCWDEVHIKTSEERKVWKSMWKLHAGSWQAARANVRGNIHIFFFFPGSWAVIPIYPRQFRDALMCSRAVMMHISPLSLSLNLSSSNSAACWESSGAFDTRIHDDVYSNELHCVLSTFVLGHEVISRNGAQFSSLPAVYVLNKPKPMLCQLRSAKTLCFILSGCNFCLDHIT